ncbi:MAG: hypothetical protein GY716_03545 [bacterium]|nr:hypothetical protein [bacterium]
MAFLLSARSFASALIGLLLVSVAPTPAVLAWHAAGPVCRSACAGTPDCCCKARWKAAREPRRHNTAPTRARSERDRCVEECSDIGTAVRHPSGGGVAAELQRIAPCDSDIPFVPGDPTPLGSDPFGAAHPRAPPIA